MASESVSVQLDESSRRVDLVFPVLPPTLDGIGDHTVRLAKALANRGCDVRILTAQSSWTPLPGVQIEEAFDLDHIRGITQLRSAVTDDCPDWLVLQFNQFSYGPYGFNPFLPLTLRSIKQARPDTRILWMAHEEYVPASNIKNAVMSTWQRAQFWALGKTADAIGVSTSRWVEKFRSWFAPTPLYHLPVGSNIPYQGVDREKARAELDVDDLFVVGFFGSPQGSRHLEHVRSALRRLSCTADGQVQLLYIGSQGDALRRALPPEVTKESFRDAGQLPADEVSLRFSAMDLYIAPFVAGVSTRRGSFMTSLQHGVPTLATLGPQTDPIFREQDGDALRLVPEEDVAGFGAAAESLYRLPEPQRRDIGETGKELYETSFDWPVLARTAEEVFDAHSQMAYSRS